MRAVEEVRRANSVFQRYHRIINANKLRPEVVAPLVALFGQEITSVPMETQLELALSELRTFPNVRSKFARLNPLGLNLIDIQLNTYLGTQNVQLPKKVMNDFLIQRDVTSLMIHSPKDKFTEARKLAIAGDLVICGIASILLQSGSQKCSEVLQQRFLSGSFGLAQLYLNHLGMH